MNSLGLSSCIQQVKTKLRTLAVRPVNIYEKLAGSAGSIQAGPGINDKIAIIGAGPAGLHMAYLLTDKGYTNVTIIEKEPSVGGKSLTSFEYTPNVPQEFGTCYTVPFKYQELRTVATSIGYELNEVPVPPRNVYNGYDDDNPVSQYVYMISEKLEDISAGEEPTPEMVIEALLDVFCTLTKYMFHVRDLLQDNTMEEIISKTDMTFQEYLVKFGFDDLIPLFSLANTAQGYGYIDQIPAFYGIWWNNAAEILGFLADPLPNGADEASILREGFQSFWFALADYLIKERNVHIRLGQEITQVNRSDAVTITTRQDGTETYDFLIVTSSPRDASDFMDIDETENQLFSALNCRSYLSTTLVAVDRKETDRPISSWSNAVNNSSNVRQLMTVRNSKMLFNLFDDVAEPQNSPTEYLMAYQYEPDVNEEGSGDSDTLQDTLIGNLVEAGYENVEVKEQHIWPYFQHFDQAGLNTGYPIQNND